MASNIDFGCTVGRRYRATDTRAVSYGLMPSPRASGFDAFTNAAARMGWNTPNLAESADYTLVRMSFDYQLLITLYRNHWISRRIVDTPAKDMVKAWPTLTSDVSPQDLTRLNEALRRTNTKSKVLKALKWARLFGGGGSLIVIDGHENQLEEPLRVDDIEIGAYRGLIPFDRWTGISPDTTVSTDITRPQDFNLPTHYRVSQPGGDSFRVHASRILRFCGPEVPAPELQAQSWWGISALEPAYEEIRKRDNMSWNILSLTFRASILGMKFKDLAQALSGAGVNQAALQQFYLRMEAMNQVMSNQSLMILPEDGGMESINYTFSGVSDVYQQFQLDISGAAEIPVARLFGRTITGLAQSNDADERIYEERIAMDQDEELRPQLEKLYPVLCASELGDVPKDLELKFPSVRVLAEDEKAELANKTSTSLVALGNAGYLSKPQVMKELKQSSDVTGFCTNITDDDIAQAEKEELLGIVGLMAGEPEGGEQQAGGEGAPEAERPAERPGPIAVAADRAPRWWQRFRR